MTSCKDCLRTWLVGMKLIILVIGLALLGFSIYVLLEPEMQAILRGTGKVEIFNIIVCTLILIGFLTIIAALIGCSGAYHENECLLGTYFIMMGIIFTVHIGAALLGYWKLPFLRCCGGFSASDYDSSLPMSCCDRLRDSCSNIQLRNVYTDGCNQIFRAHMEKWINIFCIGSASIAIIEVLSIFLTSIMYCTVRSFRKGDYQGVSYQ